MNSEIEVTVNRKYKDTVFRMLFKEKERLLELFNAVNNTNVRDIEEIEITTLENAPPRERSEGAFLIYMSTKNDISCVVDMRLSLFEHQSTVNPNMPLRDLDYVARCFSKYTMNRDIYSGKPIVLPTPKFVVFYNGTEKQPDVRELKLSDLYAHSEESPALELVVTQYNINAKENADILSQCRTLREYSQFIDCIRKHQKGNAIEEAVNLAIDECIHKGILADFLKANKAEVKAMSIYEFDAELHEKTVKDMAYEAGEKAGREAGEIAGRKAGEIVGRKAGKVMAFHEVGLSVSEIAERVGVTEDEVQEIIGESNPSNRKDTR